MRRVWTIPGFGRSELDRAKSCMARLAIGQSSEPHYGKAVEDFAEYLVACGHEFTKNPPEQASPAQCDKLLAQWLEGLAVIGSSKEPPKSYYARGLHTFYGVLHAYPLLKGSLFHANQTLKGWKRSKPGESRLPIPKGLAFILAVVIAWLPHPLAPIVAVLVLAHFDLMLRSEEGFGILKEHIRHVDGHTAVLLGEERPTKTGRGEGVLFLDDFTARKVRERASQLQNGEKLFPITESQYLGLFHQACKVLGVDDKVPHQLRHGGAVHGLLTLNLGVPAVTKRGRWANAKSLDRYGRPHTLIKVISMLDDRIVKMMKFGLTFPEKAWETPVSQWLEIPLSPFEEHLLDVAVVC